MKDLLRIFTLLAFSLILLSTMAGNASAFKVTYNKSAYPEISTYPFSDIRIDYVDQTQKGTFLYEGMTFNAWSVTLKAYERSSATGSWNQISCKESANDSGKNAVLLLNQYDAYTTSKCTTQAGNKFTIYTRWYDLSSVDADHPPQSLNNFYLTVPVQYPAPSTKKVTSAPSSGGKALTLSEFVNGPALANQLQAPASGPEGRKVTITGITPSDYVFDPSDPQPFTINFTPTFDVTGGRPANYEFLLWKGNDPATEENNSVHLGLGLSYVSANKSFSEGISSFSQYTKENISSLASKSGDGYYLVVNVIDPAEASGWRISNFYRLKVKGEEIPQPQATPQAQARQVALDPPRDIVIDLSKLKNRPQDYLDRSFLISFTPGFNIEKFTVSLWKGNNPANVKTNRAILNYVTKLDLIYRPYKDYAQHPENMPDMRAGYNMGFAVDYSYYTNPINYTGTGGEATDKFLSDPSIGRSSIPDIASRSEEGYYIVVEATDNPDAPIPAQASLEGTGWVRSQFVPINVIGTAPPIETVLAEETPAAPATIAARQVVINAVTGADGKDYVFDPGNPSSVSVTFTAAFDVNKYSISLWKGNDPAVKDNALLLYYSGDAAIDKKTPFSQDLTTSMKYFSARYSAAFLASLPGNGYYLRVAAANVPYKGAAISSEDWIDSDFYELAVKGAPAAPPGAEAPVPPAAPAAEAPQVTVNEVKGADGKDYLFDPYGKSTDANPFPLEPFTVNFTTTFETDKTQGYAIYLWKGNSELWKSKDPILAANADRTPIGGGFSFASNLPAGNFSHEITAEALAKPKLNFDLHRLAEKRGDTYYVQVEAFNPGIGNWVRSGLYQLKAAPAEQPEQITQTEASKKELIINGTDPADFVFDPDNPIPLSVSFTPKFNVHEGGFDVYLWKGKDNKLLLGREQGVTDYPAGKPVSFDLSFLWNLVDSPLQPGKGYYFSVEADAPGIDAVKSELYRLKVKGEAAEPVEQPPAKTPEIKQTPVPGETPAPEVAPTQEEAPAPEPISSLGSYNENGFVLEKGQGVLPFSDIKVEFVESVNTFLGTDAHLEVSELSKEGEWKQIECKEFFGNADFDAVFSFNGISSFFAPILTPILGRSTSTCSASAGKFDLVYSDSEAFDGTKMVFYVRVDNSDGLTQTITGPTGMSLADKTAPQAVEKQDAPQSPVQQPSATGQAGAGTPAEGAAQVPAVPGVTIKPIEPFGYRFDPNNVQPFTVTFSPSFAVRQYRIELWKGNDPAMWASNRAIIASGNIGVDKFDGIAAGGIFSREVSKKELNAAQSDLQRLAKASGEGYYLVVEVTAAPKARSRSDWTMSQFLSLGGEEVPPQAAAGPTQAAAAIAADGFELSVGQNAFPFTDIKVNLVSSDSDPLGNSKAVFKVFEGSDAGGWNQIPCSGGSDADIDAVLYFDLASKISDLASGGNNPEHSAYSNSICSASAGNFFISSSSSEISAGKAVFRVNVNNYAGYQTIKIPTEKSLAEFIKGGTPASEAVKPAAPAQGQETTPPQEPGAETKQPVTVAEGQQPSTAEAERGVEINYINPAEIDLSTSKTLEVSFTPNFAIKQYTVEIWQSDNETKKILDGTRKPIASCTTKTACPDLVPNNDNYKEKKPMAVKLDSTTNSDFLPVFDKIKKELDKNPGNTYDLVVQVTDSDAPGDPGDSKNTNWIYATLSLTFAPAAQPGAETPKTGVTLNRISQGYVFDPSNPSPFSVTFTSHFAVKQYTIDLWKGNDIKLRNLNREIIASGRIGVPKDFKGTAETEFSHSVTQKELDEAKEKISKLQKLAGGIYYILVEVTDMAGPPQGKTYIPQENWKDSDFLKLTLKGEAAPAGAAEPAECPTVLECLARIDKYNFSQIFIGMEPQTPTAAETPTGKSLEHGEYATKGTGKEAAKVIDESKAGSEETKKRVPAQSPAPQSDKCLPTDKGFVCEEGQYAQPFKDITVSVPKIDSSKSSATISVGQSVGPASTAGPNPLALKTTMPVVEGQATTKSIPGVNDKSETVSIVVNKDSLDTKSIPPKVTVGVQVKGAAVKAENPSTLSDFISGKSVPSAGTPAKPAPRLAIVPDLSVGANTKCTAYVRSSFKCKESDEAWPFTDIRILVLNIQLSDKTDRKATLLVSQINADSGYTDLDCKPGILISGSPRAIIGTHEMLGGVFSKAGRSLVPTICKAKEGEFQIRPTEIASDSSGKKVTFDVSVAGGKSKKLSSFTITGVLSFSEAVNSLANK